MTDRRNGWAVDASGQRTRVLHTADGGHSWVDVTPTYESWSIYAVPPSLESNPGEQVPRLANGTFLDGERAWITTKVGLVEFDFRFATNGRVLLSTRDAGQTWHMVMLPEDSGCCQGKLLDFVDPLHGWYRVYDYAGAGGARSTLFRTSDGGETWLMLFDYLTTSSSFSRHMTFGDPLTGLMAFPRSGIILTPYIRWSHDGGKTWGNGQRLKVPESSNIDLSDTWTDCGTEHPHLLSDQIGFVVMDCRIAKEGVYEYQNFLFRTDDGGKTWQTTPVPVGRLHMIDEQMGWILGEEIYRTADGGQSWAKVNTVRWEGQFSFVDPNHGWAVAKDEGETALVNTMDGGYTWSIIEPELLP